jgi:hypothetical protein
LGNLLSGELETQVEEIKLEQSRAEYEVSLIAIRRVLIGIFEGDVRQRAVGPQISVGKAVASCEVLHLIFVRHVNGTFAKYGLEDCLESALDTRKARLRKAVSDGSVKDTAEDHTVLKLESAGVTLEAVHNLDYVRAFE